MQLIKVTKELELRLEEAYAFLKERLCGVGGFPLKDAKEPAAMVLMVDAFVEAWLTFKSLGSSTETVLELRVRKKLAVAVAMAVLAPFIAVAVVFGDLKTCMLMAIAGPLALIIVAIALQLAASRDLVRFMKCFNEAVGEVEVKS